MRLSLSARWFLWLSGTVALFATLQILLMMWLEIGEVIRGEAPLEVELPEILLLCGASASVFLLMFGVFWFVSRKMIQPVRTIAKAAQRISEGHLAERVHGEGSSDEIGMLASTLNRAFDEYHQVLQRLDRFAGNAAHQLRTPLSSIRSIGEVCLQRERDAGEYRECINEMVDASRELTDIVEKLLLIARLDPSRVRQQFADVVLSEALHEVLAFYGSVLEEKSIEVVISRFPALTVMGDRNLIGQAIGNIVTNAVQFTPEGGKLMIAIEERGNGIVLQISDTGPGMPEALRVQMGGDARVAWNGDLPTGRMGLVIVSEIMRLHEGTVRILQREGGGTCVELEWRGEGDR
jgi:signal transduction histidine kinase